MSRTFITSTGLALAALALVIGTCEPAAARSSHQPAAFGHVERAATDTDFALLPVYLWPVARPAAARPGCEAAELKQISLDQISSFWRTAAIP